MSQRFKRAGRAIYRSPQWKAVRLQAKRRDGWQCVQCAAKGRVEVDHIKPVRTHPELAFDLSNLQCLCVPCHSRKTRIEVGMGEPDPAREAWRKLVADLQPNPSSKRRNKCLNP